MDFSDQFIKILNAIAEKLGVTADYIMPYVQDLLARIVSYEIATSIFWMVLGVIGLLGGILLFRYAMGDVDFDSDNILTLTVSCSVIIIIASTIVIGIQIYDIITAIYMPETIYLDYFYKYKDIIK